MKKTSLTISIISLIFTIGICALMSIATFEKIFQMSSIKLITYLFNKDSYDYTIQIPDYWKIEEQQAVDLMFISSNSERIKLSFKDIPKIGDSSQTDFKIIGTQFILNKKINYPSVVIESKEKKVNNSNVVYAVFNHNGFLNVIGTSVYDDFILEFEYSLDEKMEINKSLDNIIGSIKKYEVKEVPSKDENISTNGPSDEVVIDEGVNK